MNNILTEILFTVYINGGRYELDSLVGYLAEDNTRSEAPEDIRRCVGRLVSSGLLRLYIEEGTVYVALTGDGDSAALAAAEVISGRMMEEWQESRLAATA